MNCFMVVLSLLLLWDTAFRRLSIVCSRVPELDQISSQKSDDQVHLPNHKATRDKRRCIRRLQCIHPNQPQHWFHEYPTSSAVLQGPKLYVRYVHLRLGGSSENQGQSAKTFHLPIFSARRAILGFLPQSYAGYFFAKT